MILHMHAILIISLYVIYCISFPIKIRVSDRSRKKDKFLRDFQRQIRRRIGRFRGNFTGIFGANFAEKQSVKKRLISGKFTRQILLEIDRFLRRLTTAFNVF